MTDELNAQKAFLRGKNRLQYYELTLVMALPAHNVYWLYRENLDRQFSGTVRGALNTVQTALPGMRAAGFGRIINVGTNLFQNPVVPYHDYTAAKARCSR